LLSIVYCLSSAVCCLLSAICCPLSSVCCPLATGYCLFYLNFKASVASFTCPTHARLHEAKLHDLKTKRQATVSLFLLATATRSGIFPRLQRRGSTS
jgi:hypothetical protein